MKFVSPAANRDAYIKSLSAAEAVDELSQRELRKTILRLAQKHGLSTWWRIRQHYKRNDQLKDSNTAFMKRMVVDDFKAAQQKTSGTNKDATNRSQST